MAYVPTSWGRTRRPKHLKEHLPTAGTKQAQTSVAVVTVAQLAPNLNSTIAGRNGYSTENQRYLHVLVGDPDDGDVRTIDIYAYNYAFGEWTPLFLNLGAGAFQRVQAASGASGADQMYIFEIAGIDRIAFVQTGGDSPNVVRAACSTF